MLVFDLANQVPVFDLMPMYPRRGLIATIFHSNRFTVGVGGACAHFTPAVSYWCSSTVSGGSARKYSYPTSMVYQKYGDLDGTARHFMGEKLC